MTNQNALIEAEKPAAAVQKTAIDPEIIALASAFFAASGEISKEEAVRAAYFFRGTGQVEGRDSYIGTSGRVTGKVLEGYRGVARDAAERGVGEVMIEYRSLDNEEIEDHEVKPGDIAKACEVYQLRAWNMAQRMGKKYQPVVGIGIVRADEKFGGNGKQIPMIGGMTWVKKAKNRAYKDAMRHVPGGLVSAQEELDEAAEMGIEISLPEGAHLSQEQARLMIAEAQKPAPPPMEPSAAAAILAENNAKTRGAGPEWQGFGDDDPDGFDDLQSATESPAVQAALKMHQELDRAAAADENGHVGNGGNGKAHTDRPFKDQGSAVQWACRFEHYRKDGKPDIPHAVGSLNNIIQTVGCKEKEVDCWANAWIKHVNEHVEA